MMKNKEAEGDKLMKKAVNLCKPSLLELRVKPDWSASAPLYEQAMIAYKSGKCWEKARQACEKAADCQERIGSSWHAAKFYEKGAEIASEQNDIDAVVQLYKHAAHAFFEAGRPRAGGEVLFKAAKKAEASRPELASELYREAIDVLEQDETFSFGPEVFRSSIAHEIKRERFDVACDLLMKFAVASEDKGMHVSVARSYLGAIVIWLYAQNPTEALAVYRDSSAVDSFGKSDERKSAFALIEAYKNGNADTIKTVITGHVSFQFLDTAIARLALKLPKGNLEAMMKVLEDPKESEEDLT